MSAPAGRTVQVLLGERSYPIRIRPGSLAELGRELAEELGARRVAVVTTPRVRRLHGRTLEEGLRAAGLETAVLEAPEGERAKRLSVAARLYDALLETHADRATFLVAFGGGALGDLAGFVASTFLRGVPFVQVPTTLLAQVDASIGGKTAVNHPRGKNLIGTFYQPRLVWIDPETLRTLPLRDRRAGMAEVVKSAAIWDAAFFAWLEKRGAEALALEPSAITEAIARACAIKAEVVGLDEREAGLRSLLNFGHTLGHAIEAAFGFRRFRHGEAVAMGMAFAARLSERRGLAPAGTAARLEALLRGLGLPVEVPPPPGGPEAYLRAIAVDKKIAGGSVRFVVLREIGRAETVPLPPEAIVEELART